MPGRIGIGTGTTLNRSYMLAAAAGGGAIDYTENGQQPHYIADFVNDYYELNGTTYDSVEAMTGNYSSEFAPCLYFNSSGELYYSGQNLANRNLDAGSLTHNFMSGSGNRLTVTNDGTIRTRYSSATLDREGAGRGIALFELTYVDWDFWGVTIEESTTAFYTRVIDLNGGGTASLGEANSSLTGLTIHDVSIVSSSGGVTLIRIDYDFDAINSHSLSITPAAAATGNTWSNADVRTTFTSGSRNVDYRWVAGRYPCVQADLEAYLGVATVGANVTGVKPTYVWNGSAMQSYGLPTGGHVSSTLLKNNDLSEAEWVLNTANALQLGTRASVFGGNGWEYDVVEIGSASGNINRGFYQEFSDSVSIEIGHSLVQDAGGGTGWIAIGTSDATDGDRFSYFDLANGVVGTEHASHDISMFELVEGWWLCTVANDYSSTTNHRMMIYPATGDGSLAIDQSTYPQGTAWFNHFAFWQRDDSLPALIPFINNSTIVEPAASGRDTTLLDLADAAYPSITTGAVSFAVEAYVAAPMLTATGTNMNRLVDWDESGTERHLMLANYNSTPFYRIEDGGVIDDAEAASNGTWENLKFVKYAMFIDAAAGEMQLAYDGTAGTKNTTVVDLPTLTTQGLAFGESGHNFVTLARYWNTSIDTTGIEDGSA